MKYKVVEVMFPGLRGTVKENLSFEEASKLSNEYNSDCDSYTSYEVEEMIPDIKEERKEKIEQINETLRNQGL